MVIVERKVQLQDFQKKFISQIFGYTHEHFMSKLIL